jgi:hypothetical protein
MIAAPAATSAARKINAQLAWSSPNLAGKSSLACNKKETSYGLQQEGGNHE